ncbi:MULTISPECIES: helix-turn-helix domain-containing protein [unclassified Mycobacterium]|uniref:helix-turn-helix domain-containing protein n=1 Tax=unclassified Mycobacterium TaxID=2642494 RepID=UPI0009939FEE|nr:MULTISPECIES: helix-turn-helix domain-containing protein [unclassified Mycobacterium]
MPDSLDRTSAEQLDHQLRAAAAAARESLELVAALVAEAKAGRVHETLGFPSWTAYLADALGGKLHVPDALRSELIGLLAGEGVSVRGIAAVTGVSKSTVSREVRSLPVAEQSEPTVPDGTVGEGIEPVGEGSARPTAASEIVGLNGKKYKRASTPVSRKQALQLNPPGSARRNSVRVVGGMLDLERFIEISDAPIHGTDPQTGDTIVVHQPTKDQLRAAYWRKLMEHTVRCLDALDEGLDEIALALMRGRGQRAGRDVREQWTRDALLRARQRVDDLIAQLDLGDESADREESP